MLYNPDSSMSIISRKFAESVVQCPHFCAGVCEQANFKIRQTLKLFLGMHSKYQ